MLLYNFRKRKEKGCEGGGFYIIIKSPVVYGQTQSIAVALCSHIRLMPNSLLRKRENLEEFPEKNSVLTKFVITGTFKELSFLEQPSIIACRNT